MKRRKKIFLYLVILDYEKFKLYVATLKEENHLVSFFGDGILSKFFMKI